MSLLMFPKKTFHAASSCQMLLVGVFDGEEAFVNSGSSRSQESLEMMTCIEQEKQANNTDIQLTVPKSPACHPSCCRHGPVEPLCLPARRLPKLAAASSSLAQAQQSSAPHSSRPASSVTAAGVPLMDSHVQACSISRAPSHNLPQLPR